MELSNINMLAVVVAAVASFGLGAIWYSPLLFAKKWQNAVGLTQESLEKANMGLVFGSSFALIFIMNFGLAVILQGHAIGEINALNGLLYGVLLGFFFNAMSIGINMIYQRKSFALWAIDAGYQVVYLGLAGAILGAWR